MSHAICAIDGKHVPIKCPKRLGSLFYNYKGFYSIILLALVDAYYNLLWVDVGQNRSSSDAQIFNQCELKEAIEDRTIGFPHADPLPDDDRLMPYFIIGDDAFALKTCLMKPFSQCNMSDEQRIFNNRLSHARRIVENAFGIFANHFQCLLSPLRQTSEEVKSIVLACVCLHNLMYMQYPGLQNSLLDQEDDQHRVIPGEWQNVDNLVGGNIYIYTRMAKKQREYLKLYFNSPAGYVPWQDRMI